MANPFVAMLAIAGVAEGGKALFQSKEAEANKRALDLQAEQNKLQYQQKTLSNMDLTEKVIQRQQAEATTRGISLTSPSFGAIQRETLNIGAKQGANLATEFNFLEQNIKTEKQNIKNRLYAQLFGDVVESASMAFSAGKSMPRKG